MSGCPLIASRTATAKISRSEAILSDGGDTVNKGERQKDVA
jgi:hypothetical protein